MEEQNQPEGQTKEDQRGEASPSRPSQSGDPGRTPGSAEGDEATIDESIRQKEEGEQ